MSGYSSQREVREVIARTLRGKGLDPKDYNITGIVRDAFMNAGYYGWRAREVEAWDRALVTHRKKRKEN